MYTLNIARAIKKMNKDLIGLGAIIKHSIMIFEC